MKIKYLIIFFMGISFNSKITGMQQHAAHLQADALATYITTYIQDNNLEHMQALGSLLNERRNHLVQKQAWQQFIINIKEKVEICSCICLHHKKTVAMLRMFMQVVRHMLPGDDCTIKLANGAQHVMAQCNDTQIQTALALLSSDWEF